MTHAQTGLVMKAQLPVTLQENKLLAAKKGAAQTAILNANAKEIGYTRAHLVKFTTGLDGKAPMYYRKAEMVWPSMDALQKGIATPGFKKVAGDLPNFATGGIVGLIGAETQ